MKIYISGQITGLTKEEYTNNFDEVVMFINSNKESKYPYYMYVFVDIINPLDIKPFLGIKCWLCYMITDLYYLRKCSHIALQPNWESSKGAFIEHFYAKFFLKLEVIKLKNDNI